MPTVAPAQTPYNGPLFISDAALSDDGLSPYWRLSNGKGLALLGYDWSQDGVHSVGFGTQKYEVSYPAPTVIYSWVFEICESFNGSAPVGLKTAAINFAPPEGSAGSSCPEWQIDTTGTGCSPL